MSVYMYLKINALGDYKKKYDPFARLLALKRGGGRLLGGGRCVGILRYLIIIEILYYIQEGIIMRFV